MRDRHSVLIVRGTKKLRGRITGSPVGADDTSTTALGDWFATALFWRSQVALLVNERTMLPVYIPLAPSATLLKRVPAAIAVVLRRHGVEDAFIDAELAAMGEVRIGPTNNRSVVGVMNELAFSGERHWRSGVDDLEELSVRMASFRLGPLDALGGSPDRALAAVLRPVSSNALPRSPSVISAPAVARPTGVARVYQLRVTLLGTKLAVWRRVLVDGAATLADVHEVIQAAFGWWNHHLYEFEIGSTRYGIPDPAWDFGPKAHDARRTRLDQVAQTGSSFRYTYDFGDGWEHRVEVEDAAPATPAVTVPGCIDGRRACPPEDCGGPWGYQELLSILADPSHPEHEERREWVDDEWGGGTLDPEAFDPADFADNLRNVRHAAFED